MLKYVRVAKKAAEKATTHFKTGAVLVYKHKIIKIGWSTLERNMISGQLLGATLHAEIVALINKTFSSSLYHIVSGKEKKKPYKGATMYVVRIGVFGELKLSRPCNHCVKLMHAFGVKKVVFSTESGICVAKIKDLVKDKTYHTKGTMYVETLNEKIL